MGEAPPEETQAAEAQAVEAENLNMLLSEAEARAEAGLKC